MKKIYTAITFLAVLVMGLVIGIYVFNPSENKLKAPAEKILGYKVIKQNNHDVVQYRYVSDIEYPAEAGEDISKRTNNAKFFKLGEKNGRETWNAKFYCGEPFMHQLNKKWYAIKTATATPHDFFSPQLTLAEKLRKIFVADAFALPTNTYNDGPGDGDVISNLSTWSDTHDATSGTVDYGPTDAIMAASLYNTAWGPDPYQIFRAFIPVNTSALGATAHVTSASLYVWVQYVQPEDESKNVYIVQTTQASTSSLTGSDYTQCGAVTNPVTGGSKLDNQFSTSQYNNIDLDSTGLTWVNTTGYTNLGLRSESDVTNTPISDGAHNGIRFYTSSYGSLTQPYLSVTYNTYTFTSATVDWNNSNVQEITLSSARSLSFNNAQSGGFYTLIIKQDTTGGWPVTWPSNVKWAGGNALTLTSTPNAIDAVKFVYDGTDYLALVKTLDIK